MNEPRRGENFLQHLIALYLYGAPVELDRCVEDGDFAITTPEHRRSPAVTILGSELRSGVFRSDQLFDLNLFLDWFSAERGWKAFPDAGSIAMRRSSAATYDRLWEAVRRLEVAHDPVPVPLHVGGRAVYLLRVPGLIYEYDIEVIDAYGRTFTKRARGNLLQVFDQAVELADHVTL